MSKIVIEAGSTVTKVDKVENDKIERIKDETIFFKKNMGEDNKINEEDFNRLVNLVNEQKNITKDIYVCGTSVFRKLNEEQKNEFLKSFKDKTGIEFNIISQDKENELTVKGATKHVEGKKVAVFVGGGGSTEIAIYENGIKEMANSKYGVMDIMNVYPDLGEDLAKTDLEDIKSVIREKLNLPKEKADILILAGGGHKFFALNSGIKYEKNTLYNDAQEPIQMDIATRKSETLRYYKEISLDEIRNRVDDPKWWFATRAMTAFVLVVAEEIGAKYIVPTDISMVHGLIN